jgi:hypothetical protein
MAARTHPKNKRYGVKMALTQDDFKIPEEKLAELNVEIERAVSDYFTRSPEADPLDGMSVVFNFAFGFGRDLDVYVAGKTISIDLDL